MHVIASLQVRKQDSLKILDFPLSRYILCVFRSNTNCLLTLLTIKQIASKKSICRIINMNPEKEVSLFVAFTFSLGLCNVLYLIALLKTSEILALQKSLAKFPLLQWGQYCC